MQDNEFEKQVRDKLERMQMDASDTVWQRVEDGLTGERKRRRWLIWLPLMVVFLVAGYFFTGGINGDKPAQKTVQATTGSVRPETTGLGEPELGSPEPSKIKELSPTDSLERRVYAGSRNSSGAVTPSRESEDLTINSARPKNSKSSGSTTTSQEIKDHKIRSANPGRSQSSGSVEKRQRSSDYKINSSNPKNNAGQKQQLLSTLIARQQNSKSRKASELKSIPPDETRSSLRSATKQPSPETNPPVSDNTSTEKFTSDSASVTASDSINSAIVKAGFQPAAEIKTVDALHAISLPVLNPASAPVAAAWRWGLNATVGRSGITTGKFNALFYSDVAYAPNYSAGNLGNTIVVRPSQVKPALSFSVGGYVEHQLETAMYFKGGAQLSRFSTTMFVGNFKAQSVLLRSTANMADKSIGSYYTAEHTQRYTNAYTFIDIPLSLGFNFATRTKLPFAWEIGVAPSIMLGSNALHFNQGSSIYYKDNSLFKKSQFALITSLPINLHNGNRYALFVAPTFRYNSSNLFLPEINEKKHLLSAGIGVSVNFKK